MKKFLVIVAIIVVAPVCSKSGAKSSLFQSVSPDKAVLVQEAPVKKWCPNCGMSLVMFYKTSHYAVLEDGSKAQFCSMHCLADTYHHGKYHGKKVKEISGIDSASLKPYPVKDLNYIVGSKVKGTMTKRSKYAFKSKDDANKFMSENGGQIVNFEKAFAMAKEDLAADNKMVGMKRTKMMYPMGEKILNAKCNKKAVADLQYHFINELKAQIMSKSLCGKLNPKELQALALYVAKKKGGNGDMSGLNVPKDAKCPVCGMFVAKYPKWVSEVSNHKGAKYYFDGVKDMMRFIIDSKKYIKKSFMVNEINVKDYYSGKVVPGKKAFYIIGSNVTGPMGNELIPFGTEKDAKTFMNDHHGKKIVRYGMISRELVKALDR